MTALDARLDPAGQGLAGVRVSGVETDRDDKVAGAAPGTVPCPGRGTRTATTT